MPQIIAEPERKTPIIAEADLVVLGGGPAGIAAAVAASRNGAKTLLIERYGFLGGMGSAGMVNNFCGLHGVFDGELYQIVRGVALDVVARIDHFGGLMAPRVRENGKSGAQAYDIAAYKLALDDLALSSGVEIIFHGQAVGAAMEGGRIKALIIESKSGRGAIGADYFIDCSGDGDLAHFAGAAYEKGDENGFMALPTQMFRVNGVDGERAQADGKPILKSLMEQAAESGEWDFERTSGILNPNRNSIEWRVNMTQIQGRDGAVMDCTDVFDLTHAEIEGRRQVANLSRFLKQKVPGFEDSYLLEIAPQIGIRETRRVTGQYQLSGEDVLGCADFDDAIGINAWPMERHVQGGVEWRYLEGRGYHQLPFGALVVPEVENLFAAGRCASMTPDAHAAARVSGPCFAMGQAAGTAAALNLKAGLNNRETDIGQLQKALRADGACLGQGDMGDPIPATVEAAG